jgi:hypothetical protein
MAEQENFARRFMRQMKEGARIARQDRIDARPPPSPPSPMSAMDVARAHPANAVVGGVPQKIVRGLVPQPAAPAAPPVAEPAADPTPAPAAQMQAASQRTVTPLGAGREMFYQSTPQGTASGTRPAGTGQGGFVGASTDAEARRNQAARMQQDAMASANAASMDRATAAMRENRMIRRGMERGIVGGPAREPGIWDRPGDSFGDSQRRQQRYEGMLSDAANQKGFGASRRSERMLAAAEQMRAPGETAVAQRVAAGEQAARQGQSQAQLQAAQMREQGLDRRADLASRTNIETAGMAQQGQNQRKQADLEAAAESARQGRFGAGWKSAMDVLTKSDINPSRFMDWTATQFPKVAGAAGYSPEEIAAMIDDPTPQNLVVMMSMFSGTQQEASKRFWQNKATLKQQGQRHSVVPRENN